MKTGIILLNFGEPEAADLGTVTTFLERIFLANARLEPSGEAGSTRERARQLAARRAPGLLAEYRAMGGSPLNRQTAAQAERLKAELESRGRDVVVEPGMQFTHPDIGSAVDAVRSARVARVVGLPLYPLCGPSTNLAALDRLRAEMESRGWNVPVRLLGGWHVHPAYTALRVDAVRRFVEQEGLDLADPRTALVFSAHGTPVRYLREGSAYDLYVLDHCARVARALGRPRYRIGYQNHANRPGVEWTEPGIEEVVRSLDADRVVVVPVSFMQEQSETLAELDAELRAVAVGRGLGFHRVPVPHDDARFAGLLADLVSPFLNGPTLGRGVTEPDWGACRCHAGRGVVCLTHRIPRA